MKRLFALAVILGLAAGPALAGVVKQSKSQITFRGFGTFTVVSSGKVSAERSLSENKSDFKGKGLVGGLAGKTLLRSGDSVEIVDLPALMTYRLDPKKKEYTATPIEKMKEGAAAPGQAGQGQPAERQESDIKITRNEFKVEASGENKDINQFPCQRFLVTWIVDWENVKTGEKGTDKLATDVWATPTTDAIKAALQEEMAFSQGYMKAIGLEIEPSQRDVLGMSWLAVLQGLDPAGGGAKLKDPGKFAKEMGKIKGYPIVIDGKYTSVKQGGAQPAQEEEKKSGGLGGALGKFAVKALKKDKPADPNEPILSYYTEVQSLAPAALDAAVFQVPADYKKKG
jgi:hypothetical protein